MRRPSAEESITGCGTTSEVAGKSAGMEIGARSRTWEPSILMAARAGFLASECSMATALPSLVSTGDHSMASPWVTGRRDLHRRPRRARDGGGRYRPGWRRTGRCGGRRRAKRLRSRIHRRRSAAWVCRRATRWSRGASSRCLPKGRRCDRRRPRATGCRRPWREMRCLVRLRRARTHGRCRMPRRRCEWTRAGQRADGTEGECASGAAMRRKAICLASGDQTGSESRSTLGSR